MRSFSRIFSYCLHCLPGLFFITCKQPVTHTKQTNNHPVDTVFVIVLLEKGSSFLQTDFDSLKHYAIQARTSAQSIGFSEGIARANMLQAPGERNKGNYTEAVSLLLQAIQLYDSLNLVKYKIRANNILADIYKQMGGEKGTLEFLYKGLDLTREALRLAENEKYKSGMVVSMNQQGIILRDLSRRSARKDLMDTAAILYEKAIGVAEQTGEGKEILGKLYNNISQIYNEHYNNYPKALEYLFKAVAFNTENNNQNGLSYNYGNISEVYMQMGDDNKSKLYAHQMLAVTKALKSPIRIANAYLQLRRVTKGMKQYDSALYYSEMHVAISDSLNNIKKTEQIAEMQTRFETQKKEVQITALHQSNKIKNLGLWMASGVVALLFVLLGLLGFQKAKLKKQKKQITEQSHRLQWFIQELHHRVKNNLQVVSSLLNMQGHRLKNEESKAAIKESRLRVQAMSIIHQLLYQVEDVTTVNFKNYINDLAGMLISAYGYQPADIDLQIHIEKEYLDVDTVMPLALLANEIITNSFKYAYGNVTRPFLGVSLKNSEKQLLLSISDNGPGIAATNPGEGFGKKLIDMLTKQLKAVCTVETTGGTTYLFTIPYINQKVS